MSETKLFQAGVRELRSALPSCAGDQLADGELAFLSNLKAGAQTFEGDKRGLQPGTCVIAPAMIRELQRKVEQLR